MRGYRRKFAESKRNWKTEWRSATSTNKEALFAIKNGERISILTPVFDESK